MYEDREMEKKQGSIDTEFKLLIIELIIIFAFVPVLVWVSMITDDGIIQSIIVSCESIMMGILFIIAHFKMNCKKDKNYKKCTGVIVKLPIGRSGLRYPIISYEVDGKVYTVQSRVGHRGIAVFFFKGKKVKVYYDESNLAVAYTKEYISLIIGCLIILAGSMGISGVFYRVFLMPK